MMDTSKLKGITDAIESEATRPSPSHNNLARLTGMFMREIIAWFETPPEVANQPDVAPASAPAPEPEPTPEPTPPSEPETEPEPKHKLSNPKAHRKK